MVTGEVVWIFQLVFVFIFEVLDVLGGSLGIT